MDDGIKMTVEKAESLPAAGRRGMKSKWSQVLARVEALGPDEILRLEKSGLSPERVRSAISSALAAFVRGKNFRVSIFLRSGNVYLRRVPR